MMTTWIVKLLQDESGATSTEYGLLVGMISVAIVAGAISFGNELLDVFQRLEYCVDNLSITACS
jgi:Flp pilus assembly pilin Flp